MARKTPLYCLVAGWLSSLFVGLARLEAGQSEKEAFYVVSTSAEHQVPAVQCVLLRVTGREKVKDGEKVWWELAAMTRDGGMYGVRLLSDRAPMTSHEGIGAVQRYLYRDTEGRVLEYRETAHNGALLPVIQFKESFLPRAARDAVFRDEFASAGSFLGHVLVRAEPVAEPPRASFDCPVVLNLRNDLLIGTQACVRTDRAPQPQGAEPKFEPYTRQEYRDMIAAGMNYFDAGGEQKWLMYEPVFFRMTPSFPDTYYRSNWVPGRMFIDEPSVRLGWSGGIPRNPAGPEQVAEAMRQRVASHYILENRRLPLGNGAETGTLDLIAPPAVSWDTDYWSAWYQLAAGAPAIVHEGRYVKRGYGWEPEELYGPEGLEALTFRDQVNCLDAFLRGAARAFGGHWGVSVYPEGEAGLRLPALLQAYDTGARYLWFWTYPPLTYSIERELCQGISRHAAENPRGEIGRVNRAAEVGIAFPAGTVFSWQGTWGMQREQPSWGGASYGDISAAGMWEGILCSRRGIPFDFLVDEPRIRDLGYERLVVVRTDGCLEVDPPWPQSRAARNLELSLEPQPVLDVADRAGGLQSRYTVRRTGGVTVDGVLDEWNRADWIRLTSSENGFPDVTDFETTLLNDISEERWRINFTSYMGMTFKQIDEELERKYVLEDLGGKGVVVTSLEPGSPADKAGIREGDVLVWVLNRRLDWQFQMYERLGQWKNSHDKAPLRVVIRRSGRYGFGGAGDLAAEVALGVDDRNLYLAARVTDDRHFQPHHDWDFWKADSLQIGLDPTLERREAGYGEQDQEIGLILRSASPLTVGSSRSDTESAGRGAETPKKRSFAWRYHGRRGQALGEMAGVQVEISRKGEQTVYEAAIPLAELAPTAPDLWPAVGFDIVVNDSDGGLQRKGRLELEPKAMTLGKKPRQFAVLEFEPSHSAEKVSAAIFWQRRATPENGHFRMVIAARSPRTRQARLRVRLHSLDSPQTAPVRAAADLPVTAESQEHSVVVRTASPPGRYRMEVRITDPEDRIVAADAQPVYVYPGAASATPRK